MGEYSKGRDETTDTDRRRAKKKIAALWESIGFERFREGVYGCSTRPSRHRSTSTSNTAHT